MEIRDYSYQPIDSRMYVMVSGEIAVVIDPCVSEEACAYLRGKGVKDIKVLLTHEHYDHISGVNWLRSLFPVEVICTADCGTAIESPAKNLSKHYEVLFIFSPEEVKRIAFAQDVQPYSCKADTVYENNYELTVGGHRWIMTATPGHSQGSCCIVLDEECCFTGDSLLEYAPIITRFPGGSRKAYETITKVFLNGLPEGILICPGHGDRFSLKKELLHE